MLMKALSARAVLGLFLGLTTVPTNANAIPPHRRHHRRHHHPHHHGPLIKVKL